MRRQHRARRQGRANRPRRDTQRMASPSGVSSRNRPAGESESGTTLVDALSGASADAGSIPAASIPPISRGSLDGECQGRTACGDSETVGDATAAPDADSEE